MKYAEKVFHAVVLSSAVGFYSALAFGGNSSQYGTTWQIKCQQKDNGRQVVCWKVEVPNKPVPGIDISINKEEK